MKSLQNFISDFFKNKGQHIFLSLLIAKICAFAGSLFIIRILPESEFGTISIVASVFAIFAPFSGFGSQQSLLRFGSIIDDLSEKISLSKYLLKQGLIYQLLLSGLFLGIAFFYVDKYEDIFYIFLLFGFRLIGFYFLNHIQAEFRVFGNNRGFARLTNVVNVLGVILLLLLSYFYGLKGYLIAIAFTPFLALLWFRKEQYISISETFSFEKKDLWKYGFYASGTALISDTLFSADVLMLSFLLNESAVANYKVAILIPANITFLALTFMQSDFPVLAKNYKNRDFLKGYVLNYYKIFIPLAFIIFLVGFVFKSQLLTVVFSERYADNTFSFVVLLGAFCANMLLRNLYGNLLSAVGMMKMNTIISVLTLILLVIFSFILVSKYGVTGMAVSLSLSMFFGGIMLAFSFYLYWKDLK
ncbi:oligosaccharide flippase family protein [Kaistella carnis]|uniref:oligosaccharide flippase family protein n=1 Tax=Kaistella carnis TaxID=1241979 RepID=UPI0028B11EE7|nr:oligosaccharide flippase family protein [Kaistella carnis]